MINSEQIGDHFSEIAAIIGEKSRAKILWALLDGKAYTTTELAIFADISMQSCSNHLVKLVDAHILSVEKQGRHKYYRFASDKIAQIIEGIAFLIPSQNQPLPTIQKEQPKGIKYARTCYDHLAGKLGVEITTSMINQGLIMKENNCFLITNSGEKWFEQLNIDPIKLRKQKRQFAYPCLDWSERKFHIGGSLGSALLNMMLENDWIRKKKHSREIIITGLGKSEFIKNLKIEVNS